MSRATDPVAIGLERGDLFLQEELDISGCSVELAVFYAAW